MSASTKLSASIRTLCYLSETYPIPQSSSQISQKVGVNASKLRQLLSQLAKQNIVKSTKGTSGGFLIKKDPSQLNLQEVYCAIEDRKAFHLHINSIKQNENDDYEIFDTYFLGIFSDVQIDIENKFRKITLKKIMKSLGLTSKLFK